MLCYASLNANGWCCHGKVHTTKSQHGQNKWFGQRLMHVNMLRSLTSVVSLLSFELILNQVAVQRKRSFVERVLSYWVQKRQSRNNVPLIRRLQANPQPIRDSQNVSGTESPLSVDIAAKTDPVFFCGYRVVQRQTRHLKSS